MSIFLPDSSSLLFLFLSFNDNKRRLYIYWQKKYDTTFLITTALSFSLFYISDISIPSLCKTKVMSLEQDQSQQYGIASGLSLFSGQGVPKTDSNTDPKFDETNHPSSVKNTPVAFHPPSSSSPDVKLVGSNRFVSVLPSLPPFISFLSH